MLSNYSVDGLIKTSHSEVELYNKCERAHYYRYGMRLSSIKESEALIRGTAGHAAMARYYIGLKAGEDFQTRFFAAMNAMEASVSEHDVYNAEELVSKLTVLLSQYFATWQERDEELEVLEVEKEFNVPVGDDFFIKIIVDAIIRVPGVGVTVWDHKFMYDFFDPNIVDLNPQLPKYLGALIANGYDITKAYYNEIRYRETAENKANPELKFRRTPVDISRQRIVRVMSEQIRTARRIKQLREMGNEEWEKHVLRAANSMICRSCPFQKICAADLDGSDTTLMRTYEYKEYTHRKDENG